MSLSRENSSQPFTNVSQVVERQACEVLEMGVRNSSQPFTTLHEPLTAEEREEACRQVLRHATKVHRLLELRHELRADGHGLLASLVDRDTYLARIPIWRLAEELGLAMLLTVDDIAAFARAQLGLPINAAIETPFRRRRRLPQWRNDLRAAVNRPGVAA